MHFVSAAGVVELQFCQQSCKGFPLQAMIIREKNPPPDVGDGKANSPERRKRRDEENYASNQRNNINLRNTNSNMFDQICLERSLEG